MIHIVCLYDRRRKGERLRVGAVRRPPRGKRREDVDEYDVRLPELAPSSELLKKLHSVVYSRQTCLDSRGQRIRRRMPASISVEHQGRIPKSYASGFARTPIGALHAVLLFERSGPQSEWASGG